MGTKSPKQVPKSTSAASPGRQMLRFEEIEEEYGVRPDHLREAHKKKELRVFSIGRSRLVDRADFETWVRKHPMEVDHA